MYWSKAHEIKSKYKFKFNLIYLIFTLPILPLSLILIIDNAESCFLVPLFNPILHYGNLLYRRFSTSPVQARKQSARAKTCFFFKDQIKISRSNNLRLFKLDSKILTCVPWCWTSTKWWNLETTATFILLRRYSNKNYSERPSAKLFMACNIKPLKLVLAQVVKQHGKKVSRNLILVVL